jgi:hypothetical protein
MATFFVDGDKGGVGKSWMARAPCSGPPCARSAHPLPDPATWPPDAMPGACSKYQGWRENGQKRAANTRERAANTRRRAANTRERAANTRFGRYMFSVHPQGAPSGGTLRPLKGLGAPQGGE